MFDQSNNLWPPAQYEEVSDTLYIIIFYCWFSQVSHQLTRFHLPRVNPRLSAVRMEMATPRPLLRDTMATTRNTCPPSSERSLRPDSSLSGRGEVDKARFLATLTMVMHVQVEQYEKKLQMQISEHRTEIKFKLIKNYQTGGRP